MKLLMLIVDDERKEEVEVFLTRSGVEGFTELPGAAGIGTTAPRLGSAAFPRTSTVILTVVADEKATSLADELRRYCAQCGERVKAITWSVETLI